MTLPLAMLWGKLSVSIVIVNDTYLSILNIRGGHHVREQGETKDSESSYIKYEHP